MHLLLQILGYGGYRQEMGVQARDGGVGRVRQGVGCRQGMGTGKRGGGG